MPVFTCDLDTRGGDSDDAQTVAEVADLRLLPARPPELDIEATVDTFRSANFTSRKAVLVLLSQHCVVLARLMLRKWYRSLALWPEH